MGAFHAAFLYVKHWASLMTLEATPPGLCDSAGSSWHTQDIWEWHLVSESWLGSALLIQSMP